MRNSSGILCVNVLFLLTLISPSALPSPHHDGNSNSLYFNPVNPSAFNAYFNNLYDKSRHQYSDFLCLGHSMNTRSCIFTNVCFAPRNKSFMFYYEEGITSLPPDIFVDPEGIIFWPNDIFAKDWKVPQETTYVHEKSLYESTPGDYSFKPTAIRSSIPSDTAWEKQPFMFFTRTRHDDNAGHLVFDFYHPVLTAIASHIGMSMTINVTAVDGLWRPHSFSRYNGQYDKWKDRIGGVLFKNQFTYREFFMYTKQMKRHVCFEQLLVGCGKLAGLEGHVLHRQQSIRYIRQMLWEKYAPQRQTSKKVDSNITILMLHKNSSNWRLNSTQVNYVTNWFDLVRTIKAMDNVTVINIVPYQTPFDVQVQLYRNADITVSVWGGISMLNFLMEPRSVEILITSWFKDFMPFPLNSTGRTLICPDFDDRARLSLDNKSLRYCTRDEGLNPNYIDVEKFMKLTKLAVEYLRWKRSTAQSS